MKQKGAEGKDNDPFVLGSWAGGGFRCCLSSLNVQRWKGGGCSLSQAAPESAGPRVEASPWVRGALFPHLSQHTMLLPSP